MLVALAGCSDGGGGGDAGDATTTTPVVRSTAEEGPLRVGQCGDIEDLRIGVVDPAAIVIVDCAEPHDVEVGAVFEHPADGETGFPGADPVDGYAFDECIRRFGEYVGTPYADSTLDFAIVAPGEEGWDDGDRRIACVLYHFDLAPLIGSVEGLGI